RLTCFFVSLSARAADFGANAAGKGHIQRSKIIVTAANDGACAFKIFLQLEWITLDGEVEVPDGKARNDIANGAAGKVNVHPGIARDILNQNDALLLAGRQPQFHCVYVVSHSSVVHCCSTPYRSPGTGQKTGWPDR